MIRYKNYKLIKPDESQINQINRLIIKNKGSIFHGIELNRIIEQEFNSELYYLVDDKTNIQHAAVVHLTRNKVGLKQFNIRPLYDIPYAGFIEEEIVDMNKFKVNFFESVSYAGFPYTRRVESPSAGNIGETSMVDLKMNEDDIFNKVIHSKRRNMIRKAFNVGITVKSYFNIQGFKLFWPLLADLHEKLGYTNLTFNYYQNLFLKFSIRRQAFILIAFKNEIPISGVFVLGNNNYMHYYKGASLTNIKNEGHGELLQWEAIKTSKNLESDKYDLCNLNKEKLPDIYRFKTGISNELYIYQKYRHNSTGYRIVNRIIKSL